jgi:beta-1,4-N-acetylglucosaminyltransferase
MSVCVVCSCGGHLSEALAAIRDIDTEYYIVTYDEGHVRTRLAGKEVYYIDDPHRSILRYLKNTWQSLVIFLRKRPRVVISTGAGITLATCFLAKLSGRTLIFIESGARVKSPSRTGRLLYHFADLFIVQWKPLLRHYPKAVYGGPL